MRQGKKNAIYDMIVKHSSFEKSQKEIIKNEVDKEKRKLKKEEFIAQRKQNRETIKNMKA